MLDTVKKERKKKEKEYVGARYIGKGCRTRNTRLRS